MPTQVSQAQEKQGWIADAGRRRSMRVLLSVPVIASGKTSDKKDFTEETRTLVVNAHGALISLGARVAKDQKITIQHKATQETLDCRVVYVGNAQGAKPQMGLEFVSPSPSFWRIDFPPDDWVVPEN